MENDKLQLFEDKAIRTAWDEEAEEWYFSIVDVVAVLTDSPNPQTYWRVLKKRLKDEGNETVTNCNALKMTAADGKKRLTDVATTEQLLRIIQSIPSPKAEPFKLLYSLRSAARSGSFFICISFNALAAASNRIISLSCPRRYFSLSRDFLYSS